MTAVEELRFEVLLPPGAMSPNRKAERHHRSRMARGYRAECALLASDAVRRAGWSAPPMARVGLVFATGRARVPDGRYRPRDCDNAVAAAKPLFDALRDAGVIVDDRAEVLSLGEVLVRRFVLASGPGVVVTVEAVP